MKLSVLLKLFCVGGTCGNGRVGVHLFHGALIPEIPETGLSGAAFLALFCAPNAFSAEEISGPVIGIDLGMFAKCNEP
jgi:hypothetical protein